MNIEQAEPLRLRVASYNVRKCVGLDQRRMPGRVLDAISEVEADVVALQEVDKRLGERPSAIPRHMFKAQTDFEPVDLAPNGVSLGWHGNAVLVRRGFRVKAAVQLDLPYLEPRGAVLVELEHQDRLLRFVGVHLGLTRKVRQRQLTAINAAMAVRQDMPTVILGDFNEWSRDKGLDPLASEFDVHSPGRSFHSARPVAALDRIATSRDISLEGAGVHETGVALKASDHLPIWADLALKA